MVGLRAYPTGRLMARIRSVKPSLRTSRVVAQWKFEVRYFWVLLWGYLDDQGRGLDIPKTIAGDCFPLDDDVTPTKVDRWLTLIASTKFGDKEPPLCRYEVGGTRYIHAVNWTEHQRPNRPSPSPHPHCPTHVTLTEPFTEPDTEHALSPHVLEVGGRREELGSGGPPPEPGSEPNRQCRDHRDDPDPPNCRRCRTAREAWERWSAAKRAHIAAIPHCAEHPGQPAINCAGCRADRLVGSQP